jgi:plastocyanin
MKGILITIVIIIVVVLGYMFLSSDTYLPDDAAITPTSDGGSGAYSDDEVMEGDAMQGQVMEKKDSTDEGGDAMEKTGDDAMEKTSDSAMEKTEPVVIKMTASGFLPVTVTVLAGTEVQFVNSDVKGHWPASAIHPTHLVLPEFDARKSILPGETYSYTFTKKGEWLMHDHIFPARTGKIIVE